jgi:NADH-quinone oxidoreductase subunit F
MIANADEMEPGTFKDRLLLECDPHQMIEGLVIGAFAIEAELGYVFIRSEYTKGAEIVQRALDEAYARHYLGKNILGTDFSYDLRLHVSAGRYMCGEETSLLNSLEGKRAMPRTKPPHPTAFGLWGKPTIVNNVETICQVPGIIVNGAEWFKSLSLTGEAGTKLYGVCGKVRKQGVWELPMGTTIRELIEVHAGGMCDGFALRALIPGGASTEFVMPESLDTPMDFASMKTIQTRLGTGTIIILDDKTCPIGMLQNLQEFYARESCGWCTPCRDGIPWVAETLKAIEEGRGESEDIGILEMHTRFLAPGRTFCALAPGAMEPLQSGLKFFAEDFQQHIREKRCPYRGSAKDEL